MKKYNINIHFLNHVQNYRSDKKLFVRKDVKLL